MYDEVLLDHNLHPQCKGELSGANLVCQLSNQSCGDELTIMLKLEQGRIVAGKFCGVGCAIAQASADLMIEALIGLTVEEAKELRRKVDELVVRGEVEGEEVLGELAALKTVARMPARAACAKLAWKFLDCIEEENVI